MYRPYSEMVDWRLWPIDSLLSTTKYMSLLHCILVLNTWDYSVQVHWNYCINLATCYRNSRRFERLKERFSKSTLRFTFILRIRTCLTDRSNPYISITYTKNAMRESLDDRNETYRYNCSEQYSSHHWGMLDCKSLQRPLECQQCLANKHVIRLTCLTNTTVPWTCTKTDVGMSLIRKIIRIYIYLPTTNIGSSTCSTVQTRGITNSCCASCTSPSKRRILLYKTLLSDYYHPVAHVQLLGEEQLPPFWQGLVQLAKAHVEPYLFRGKNIISVYTEKRDEEQMKHTSQLCIDRYLDPCSCHWHRKEYRQLFIKISFHYHSREKVIDGQYGTYM